MQTNYTIGSQINEGSYGKIYCTNDDGIVCKRSDNSPIYGLDEAFLREVSSMRSLANHPYLVKVCHIDCDIQYTRIFEIKYPYNLHEYIHHAEENLGAIKIIMYELLQIIATAHKNSIINGDLKPGNILLDDNDQVAVCDWGFGLCISKYTHKITSTPTLQTLLYRAPEVLCRLPPYTETLDVWSLGIILCELINHKLLFADSPTEHEQLENIFKIFGYPSVSMWNNLYTSKNYTYNGDNIRSMSQLKSIVKTDDQMCLDLIDQMTQYDPEKRCCCEDALKHPYFAQIYQPNILNYVNNLLPEAYIKDIDPLKYSAEMGFTRRDREVVIIRAFSSMSDYRLPVSVYIAGVVYFDEYLSGNKIKTCDLLINCLCCMLIAVKINGYLDLDINNIIEETRTRSTSYRSSTIRQLEVTIVEYFKYSLFRPNLYHILQYYLDQMAIKGKQRTDIMRIYCQMMYNSNFYRYEQHKLVTTLISYTQEHLFATNNEIIKNVFGKCGNIEN